MSYEAIVTRLTNVREHPNADKLKLATVSGFQIVVGLDAQEGELGIFFPCDGQLSEEYAEQNDLVGYTDPTTGDKRGGYFAKNRRVRSQRLRGEKSDGYFASLDSVAYTGVDIYSLVDGLKFDTLNNKPICNKYYTPATLKAMKGGTQKVRKEYPTFPKHVETDKYQYLNRIPENAVIYITEKLHGTSGRFGYVSVEHNDKRTWLQRLLRRPVNIVREYEHLAGTRNVVLDGGGERKGYYSDESFRTHAIQGLQGNLHKGEVIYFELVGYTTDGALIMPEVDTSVLKDKEISKKYGKKMRYTYGMAQGVCDLYVYRIAHTNEDGVLIELPWNQVKARCKELGVKHVPEIWETVVCRDSETKGWLDMIVNNLMEGPSTVDEQHIREGVVLRIESPEGTEFVKSKSFTFGVLEGYIKERDDYVDMEEAS